MSKLLRLYYSYNLFCTKYKYSKSSGRSNTTSVRAISYDFDYLRGIHYPKHCSTFLAHDNTLDFTIESLLVNGLPLPLFNSAIK